jgi:predicted metalloprotease with PDZ domain
MHASMAGAAALATLSCTLLAPLTSVAAVTPPPRDEPYVGTVRLQVDATDLDHRIFRIREQLPVRPGPLTLLFPRFLPGTHGPFGQVDRLAGLEITAGGKPLAWRRDTVDPYAFQVDVPRGTSELSLAFQFLSALSRTGGRIVVTQEMADVQWNSLLLYPAGHYNSAITFQASLTLPEGWKQASALPVDAQNGTTVAYRPVSLETLVDSPVYAGANVRRIELDPPGATSPVALDLVADDPSQLEASEAQIQAHRNLVVQADRLFGARHFGHYDLLLAISDRLSRIGLEHHESSENGVSPAYFKDWARRPGQRELLPHEYVHSWNGKFRRPSDLWTPSYEVPMQDSLLWVYEGQTQFWGRVLAARSGLVSIEQAHYNLANVAAAIGARSGRAWRNLQDTTNEGTMSIQGRNKDWSDWQRGADYYDEATLIWLDADTLIREKSGGTRSLDDFARAFFGVDNGRIKPLVYGFDDVVAALNAVQPYDWRTFLRERLDAHESGPLLEGLTRSGWKLAWSAKRSEFAGGDEGDNERADDFAYSLGVNVRRDGTVDSVLWDSPAFRAGVNKFEQIVAVDGVAYKLDRFTAAIGASPTRTAPIELLLKEGERYRTVRVDYHGGLRYPHLERIADRPELLDSKVLAPKS